MKRKDRKSKLLALQSALNGNVAALKEYHRQQQDVFYMVVCDNDTPEPTDFVDTRLPDEQGRTRVTYADFLKNPLVYGQRCITVD